MSEFMQNFPALGAQAATSTTTGGDNGKDDVATNSYYSGSEATKTNSSSNQNSGVTYNNNNNDNNNYVNFNQFIMQHNLISNGVGATRSSYTEPNVEGNPFAAYNGCMMNAQLWAANYNVDNCQQEPQCYNSFNLGPYAASYQQQQQQHMYQSYNNMYDSFYTPFGSNSGTGGDGTGQCAEALFPMSSPFNEPRNYDLSATSLQASAPEFVPRFSKLKLNDDDGLKQGNAGGGDANNGWSFGEMSKTTKEENKVDNDKEVKENSNLPSSISSSSLSDGGVVASVLQSTEETSSSGNQQGGVKIKTYTFDKRGNSSQNGGRKNNGNNYSRSEKIDKASAARAERERERDNRRFNNNNGHINNSNNNYQSNNDVRREDRNDRDRDRDCRNHDRYERGDRYERQERGSAGGGGGRRGHDRDYHSRYDNHRSNKRRDDWNRNRDRINGFRVEEKFSNVDGKDSPLPSPEKKSPKKIYAENEKLSQREKLIRDIETRRLECLVCVELIKSHHAVWSCHNCYHILHLQCITKWASSSKSEDGWRCPACQNVEKDVPSNYYCFCGKVKNPPYNRQDIAHSCGEICARVEGCTHACTLLCHPGPCPPCQASVQRECGCGKTAKTMQCCQKDQVDCDSICGKLLNCELHTCKAKCHLENCEPCAEKVKQTCHCSRQEREVICTRDTHDKLNYSCGKPCGKDLSCGNHKCKDSCHPGECRPCKLSPEVVTSCPCGKMPIPEEQRKSCLDPIPVCEGVCGKTLRCGKPANPHRCVSKCHAGNCPPCNKQTAVKCRCGHMDQMIKCRQLSTRADDARCKKRCVKKRSCGKHKCNQECCIDIDHICPLPCSYTLSCGKHKCDQPCHRGNCPPCYRSSFEELYCECGAEVIYPPVPCGTKRPICKRPCSRTHPCEHPPQHNCHAGATCPPCMILTTKYCFGKHEQRKTIPCSQESFSCGLPCGKELPCGRHKCIKPCHEGPCQTANEICKQSCTTARSNCGHKCMAPCHEGHCPEAPCKEMVEVQCECGHRKQNRHCHEVVREYSRIATAQLASSMAEIQRGNYIQLNEILSPVKINKTNKTLDCNEECRLIERNRRLAIGLQVRNPDVQQKLNTKYSEFIRNFAKRDPALVKSIHEALTNLVKLAKESKQKSRSHSFPVMNREKRQLVHEMCEMFGVDSVAYDAEPNRNVVATAHKEKSWLPATSIMEVMQREAGQRRVPVPNNNAWGLKK